MVRFKKSGHGQLTTNKVMSFVPGYISLYKTGELEKRIARLMSILQSCALCPRKCEANRVEGNLGVCGAGIKLKVSSIFPHFGEERPLVGKTGSGTIFFTYCNLKCLFCQNYTISHLGEGIEISPEELAQAMVSLQQKGCHNINLVTPTHFVPQIIYALPQAIAMGLRLPLVYNCGGYESLNVIELLEGIVDIYMPDAKFADPDPAHRYCQARDYPDANKIILKEMHRQAGILKVDQQGIARRGLLIRHLVMPEGLGGTEKLLKFIAEELSKDSYVNIMAQYFPQYKALNYPELSRRISSREYQDAIAVARSLGLHRGFPGS